MADLVITEKEKLVEIANAIREKAGTSDAMAFDAMASAISDISSGFPVAYGTFTLTSTKKDHVVTHNLGVTPSVVFYWIIDNNMKQTKAVAMSVSHDETIFPSSSVGSGIATIYQKGNAQDTYRILTPDLSDLTSQSVSNFFPAYGGAVKANASTFELCDSSDSCGLILAANVTYSWIAIGGLV